MPMKKHKTKNVIRGDNEWDKICGSPTIYSGLNAPYSAVPLLCNYNTYTHPHKDARFLDGRYVYVGARDRFSISHNLPRPRARRSPTLLKVATKDL